MGCVFFIGNHPEVKPQLSYVTSKLGCEMQVFTDAEMFLEQATETGPAVIVSQMQLPTMSALELQYRVRKRGWNPPVIFMCNETQSREIIQAVKHGACDFIVEPFVSEELQSIIQDALERDRNQMVVSAELKSLRVRYESLTPREKQICGLLSRGLMNKQIAVDLNISDVTVKVHKARVLEKMQVSSLQELAVKFLQLENH